MIVLKIFLFILLGILAVVLLLLLLPITADVSFIGGDFKYRVKYAFADVLDSEKESGADDESEKSRKRSKSRKKKKKPEFGGSHNENNEKPPEKKAENTSEDKPPETAEGSEIKKPEEKSDDEKKSDAESGKKREKTLGDKVEFALKLLEIANRPVRHLLKRIRIADLYVDFLAADEDACKCAVKYGEVSGVVYNLIAILGEFFTVSYKTVDIECGYNQKESRWDFSFRLRFVPMTAAVSAVWLFIGYFFKIYMPQKRKTGKSEKTAGAQPLGSN